MGLREDILKPKPLEPVAFPVQWGDAPRMLWLRRFTAAQAAEWHKFAQNSTDDTGNLVYPDMFRAKLVQLSVVTEGDELVFKPEDVSVLCSAPSGVIAEIFLYSCKLNGLTNAEVAEARANFLAALKTLRGTGSPPDSAKPTSPPSVSDSPPKA